MAPKNLPMECSRWQKKMAKWNAPKGHKNRRGVNIIDSDTLGFPVDCQTKEAAHLSFGNGQT